MLRHWITCGALAVVLASPMLCRAAEPSAEQRAAAMDLLKAMNAETLLTDTINQTLDMQLKQNPAMARFRPTMDSFFKKYMSWDVLKDEMSAIYAQEFSMAELKDLTAFFKTPVGQKFANKQSTLMSKGGQLGQRRVQEHIAELQEAIRAEAAKGPGASTAGEK